MKKLFSTFVGLLAIAMTANAVDTDGIKTKNGIDTQAKDSLRVNQADKSGDVLLNASSATDPRAVPIGLPAAYTIVTQDGLPAVYFWDPNTTQVHWRNEYSLRRVGSLPMSKTALLQGEVGVGVDSYSELGSDLFQGRMKYNTNTNGKHNFDVNISGPLAKNWYYSLAAYQNFDPGSTQLAYTNFADRAQFYTAALTHKFNQGKSQFTLAYKHTNVHLLNQVDQNAPFIYNGDGSITELEGFRMGRDTYSPIDGRVTYMDVTTGEMKETNYYDGARDLTHEGRFLLDHLLNNGMKLSVKAKVSTNNFSHISDGTNTILRDQTREYADGSGTYTGDVQRRLFNIYKGHATDAIFIATLNKKTTHHDYTWGVFNYFNDAANAHSSTQYDHEVAPNPRKLLFNGNLYFNNNASAEFMDGWENRLGAYFIDTWRPTDFLRFTYGGRLEYFSLGVDNISDGRFAGFYLGGPTKDGSSTIGLTHYDQKGLNYAFSFIPTINFTDNFGFDGEVNFLTMYRHLQGYYGTGRPIYTDRPHTLARAGFFWNLPWMSLVTSFTYSFRKNDAGRITVPSEDPNVASEMVNYTQAIRTMGWKTDVLFTPGRGFKMNVVFTLQSPKLADYSFSAYGKDYNFAGNYAPNLSTVLLDMTPSYTYKNFNISATIRYENKKYANVGNSVYFNGYWETFANASYKVNKHLTFTANVVNFLNQRGAAGNVPGSQLVTDGSQFAGTIIAGSYIRPFEASIGVQLKF